MAVAPTATDNDVVEIAPDFSLKEKIGKEVNISEIFDAAIIKSSQEVINKSQKDFLKWVQNDLLSLENAYKAAENDQKHAAEFITEIRKIAFSVKAQSGTFGFDLGSAVAKSLYDFCENHYRADPGHLIVIRKHIDTLRAIFHHNVAGNGGKIGEAVFDALGKLINKYA